MTKVDLLAVISVALLLGATSCDSAPPIVQRTPKLHRPAAPECSMDREPGTCLPSTGGAKDTCTADSDCPGTNGRCEEGYPGPGGHGPCRCSSDACFADSDCGAAAVCLCRPPNTSGLDANACVPATCHVDADCAGGFCSPTASLSCPNLSGIVGTYCHTAKDECVDDTDCNTGNCDSHLCRDPLPGYCVFSPVAGHWICAYQECAY